AMATSSTWTKVGSDVAIKHVASDRSSECLMNDSSSTIRMLVIIGQEAFWSDRLSQIQMNRSCAREHSPDDAVGSKNLRCFNEVPDLLRRRRFSLTAPDQSPSRGRSWGRKANPACRFRPGGCRC